MRAKAGSDHINIERQLREIARDKHYWEQKRDRIRQTDRKVEELEQSYAEQLQRIRQERQEILRRAKSEAQEMLAEANRRIENTIKEIREAQAEKEFTRLARRSWRISARRSSGPTARMPPVRRPCSGRWRRSSGGVSAGPSASSRAGCSPKRRPRPRSPAR